MTSELNFKVKDKSIFSKRKKYNFEAKKKLAQLTDFLTKVYLKNFPDVDEKVLKVIIFKSTQIISDALFYYKFINIKKNKKNFFVFKSSGDLEKCSIDGTLLYNIDYLSKNYNEHFDFDFDFINIYDKGLDKINLGLSKIFFLNIIKLFNFKKKIITDIINIKLYFKFLIKGYQPSFLNSDKLNKEFFLNFDKKLRTNFFRYGKEIYNSNRNDFKNINLKEIYILLCNLPINIVENFYLFQENIKKIKNKNYKKIILARISSKNDNCNFWLYNHLLSENTSLEVYQHGAGYLFIDYDPLSDFEISFSNKFYSWIKNKNSNCLQYPVMTQFKKSNKKKYDILLINSDWASFYKINSTPFSLLRDKNRLEQINFIKKINYTDNYIIKDPPILYENYGDLYKKKEVSDNKITNINLKFIIPQSKICVCSYIGSTFFELMSSNIPFISFTKLSENVFSSDAEKYMKKLKEFGVLFYSGNSAANFLNKNHLEFYQLWEDKNFSQFREEFKKKFCNNINNWQDLFIK